MFDILSLEPFCQKRQEAALSHVNPSVTTWNVSETETNLVDSWTKRWYSASKLVSGSQLTLQNTIDTKVLLLVTLCFCFCADGSISWRSFSPLRLIALGSIVTSVCALSFGPFIAMVRLLLSMVMTSSTVCCYVTESWCVCFRVSSLRSSPVSSPLSGASVMHTGPRTSGRSTTCWTKAWRFLVRLRSSLFHVCSYMSYRYLKQPSESTPLVYLLRCSSKAAGGGGASSSLHDWWIGSGVSALGPPLRLSLHHTHLHSAVHPGESQPHLTEIICHQIIKLINLLSVCLLLSEAGGGVYLASSSRCSGFPALPAALRSRLIHVRLARPREGHPHCHPAAQVSVSDSTPQTKTWNKLFYKSDPRYNTNNWQKLDYHPSLPFNLGSGLSGGRLKWVPGP